MKLQEDRKFDLEEAKESIKEIAEENELLALATVSEKSEALNATAFFAFDEEFNFYILTEPDTDHGQNLEGKTPRSRSRSMTPDRNGATTRKAYRYSERQKDLKRKKSLRPPKFIQKDFRASKNLSQALGI